MNITTGYGRDIEKATSIAHRIVTQFGMDGKQEHYAPLREENFKTSMWMKEQLDRRLQQLLIESNERVTNLLKMHLKELHVFAEALLKHETLDGDEIRRIIEGAIH